MSNYETDDPHEQPSNLENTLRIIAGYNPAFATDLYAKWYRLEDEIYVPTNMASSISSTSEINQDTPLPPEFEMAFAVLKKLHYVANAPEHEVSDADYRFHFVLLHQTHARANDLLQFILKKGPNYDAIDHPDIPVEVDHQEIPIYNMGKAVLLQTLLRNRQSNNNDVHGVNYNVRLGNDSSL